MLSLFVHLVEDLVLTPLAAQTVVPERLFERDPREEDDDRDQPGDGHVVPLGNDLEEVLQVHLWSALRETVVRPCRMTNRPPTSPPRLREDRGIQLTVNAFGRTNASGARGQRP